jgi:hypothetical protein
MMPAALRPDVVPATRPAKTAMAPRVSHAAGEPHPCRRCRAAGASSDQVCMDCPHPPRDETGAASASPPMQTPRAKGRENREAWADGQRLGP